MAAGLYGRVASRGFPSSVADGLTGAGALDSQGHPVSPAHGQNPYSPAQQTLTGFQPEGPPAPAVEILEGSWGLPGTIVDPDQTPGPRDLGTGYAVSSSRRITQGVPEGTGPSGQWTHAAPFPGRAGSYHDHEALDEMHQASQAIHSVNFGAAERFGRMDGVPQMDASRWQSDDPGTSLQVPLTGPARVLGGSDAVQGYDFRNRYGFDAGHKDRTQIHGNVVNAYLDPAERPFIVPQAAGTFVMTDAVQGPEPWASHWSGEDINATPPTAWSPPAEPDTLPSQLPGAPASAGWW